MKIGEGKMRWLPYVVGVIFFTLFGIVYCMPLLEGKVLQAGDVMNWEGASHEAREYKEQTGKTTWWTNSMFGGMPTFQITGSTPANQLRGTMERTSHLGFQGDWGPIGILIAYLIGFYLMLLCFGVNPWLSILGAFGLALSSYFMLIIPAGHLTKASGLAALAPMIGGMYAIFRGRYWLGAPLFTIYGIIGITLHPQMTYYVGMLLGVLIIGELYIHVRERSWSKLGIALSVLLVCGLLIYGSKMSWIEMNTEYLAETMRGGHSELNQEDAETSADAGLDLQYATAWSYGVGETMTLMIPNFMGGSSGYDVGTKSVLYDELVKARVPKQSAKQFCSQAPTYWGEKAFTSGPVYIGAILCFLFVLGLLIVDGPYKWTLLIATIFSILLSWGRNFMPLTEFFYQYFPMYNKFRAVESILVVAEITMPLLGILAVQKMVSSDNRKQYITPIWVSAAITGGICLLVALFGGSLFDFTSSYDTWKGQVGNDIYNMVVDQRASMMRSDAWRSLLFIVLSCGLLLAYVTSEKIRKGHLYAALGVLLLADMVPVDRRYFGSQHYVSGRDHSKYFGLQSWEEDILRDKDLSYRVLNVAANTFNDSRTSYRLKSVGGYSAAKLRRYQDLIDAHITRNNMSVLNMLNTRYFVTRDGVRYNPDAYGNAWYVDGYEAVNGADAESAALWQTDLRRMAVVDTSYTENKALIGKEDMIQGGSGTIRMTSYAPDVLEYASESEQDGMVVFSEIYYPKGWRIYIDEQEESLYRVNYTLRGALVPAGKHQIRMEFVPAALGTDRWSMACIIVALLLSLTVLVLHFVGKGRVSTLLGESL